MERVQRAVDAGGIVGQEKGPYGVSYTSRDLLIYALGVGSSELRYLFEGAPGFAALPTFTLTLPYKGTSADIVPFPGELRRACTPSLTRVSARFSSKRKQPLPALPVDSDSALEPNLEIKNPVGFCFFTYMYM